MSDKLDFGQASLKHLESLREHPAAPKYNFQSSDRLTTSSLRDVQQFGSEVLSQAFWEPGNEPLWLEEFAGRLFREVPYYREMGYAPRDFQAIPTIGREDLAQQVEDFVPDSVALDDLTLYTTSGTTGSRLKVPSDVGFSSKVLVLLDRILADLGLALPRGAGKVALAAVFCQQQTLTYPSLSSYLNGAATLKLNLHPAQWRTESDPRDFLMEMEPAVITGCPYSLAVLSDLAPELRPLAMFSSAVSLGSGLQTKLEEQFSCPVFDIYSLTEAKFLGVRTESKLWRLLSPDTFVEILDPEGCRVEAGQRGEIVVSCGRNKFLPLLRYRTGDYAQMEYSGKQPYLRDLQGRAPVELVNSEGQAISNLDIIHLLGEEVLVGFSFVQAQDRTYQLKYCGDAEPARLEQLIKQGTGLNGQADRLSAWEGKPQQFSRR